MEKETKNRVSLITKLIVMVAVFGIVSLVLNGIYTYFTQTTAYHRECEENLRHITGYLQSVMAAEGDDFNDLKSYFAEHSEELLVPADFDRDYSAAETAFKELFHAAYPDKIYGIDISFAELSEEVKAAYALYRYEYWLSVFHTVQADFHLVYTYFIYPLEEEPYVCYMIDPAPDVREVDGKDYLVLAASGPEDPQKYPMMWEAWHTLGNPSGFDIFDNEYGYNYAYYAPLVVNGEGVGLIGAEIGIEKVKDTIMQAVLSQFAGYLIVLILGIGVMIFLARRGMIDRLRRLEKSIVEYSENKDTAVAEHIRKYEKGSDEIRSISDHFVEMVYELKDYMTNLQKVTAEKERIGAELNVATQIQADMLPRIFPPFPSYKEFDLFASMDPAKEVGGDFYDFFLVDPDHLALVVADVSGKGVPAALFMVIAKTLIKNRALMGGSPAEILTDVNNQLCEGNEAELFVTVWLAIIELSTGKGIAANAGHEHPALRRSDGSFELIKYRHSPAVATMEGLRFREHEFELHPGDTLVEYTDGVTEATDSSNELFGEERLLEALNQQPEADPEEILHALREHIDRFVGDAPQFDDITMMCFHYNGSRESEDAGNAE